MKRGLFFLILLAIWAGDGRAAESSLKTLLTGDDSRGWNAVGRLNFGHVSFCTGALIAPDLVLTAAHCLFHPDTGERLPVEDIEFLADWRGGRAAAYRGARQAIAHPDFSFESEDFVARVTNDLALIQLDQPIRNTSITPFATHPGPRTGDEVGVVSYAFDRADSPSLQEVCKVLERRMDAMIFSCDVDFGSSGAPIFVVENGVAEIVSVVSAKAELYGERVALGMTLDAPLSDLMAMLDSRGDGVFGAAAPVVRRITTEVSRGDTGAKFVRP